MIVGNMKGAHVPKRLLRSRCAPYYQLARRPFHGAAAQEMQMDVVDLLTTVVAAVED